MSRHEKSGLAAAAGGGARARAGAGAGAVDKPPSQLFHNLNAAAGGYGLWVEHLAKAAPGRWGAIAATAATAPIGFGLSMGATGGDTATSAAATAADTAISAAGGGSLLAVARVAQVADHYAPSVGGMQSFYQSLDPNMQELLGQPDLALYGILRGGVWLAARAGDAVDLGTRLILNPISTFKACTASVKEMFKSLVPSAAAAEWKSTSPEAMQSLLQKHAETFAATNDLKRGGRMAYLSCLEEVLSDGILRFDAETGKYQYPKGLEALLAAKAATKNGSLSKELATAESLLSDANISSTKAGLKQMATAYADKGDGDAQQFESNLSLIPELTSRFKEAASGRKEDEKSFSLSAKTVGESCYQLGNIGSQLATGAMLLGGHKRTWQGVSLASQGLMQFGQAAMALPGLISSGAGMLPLMSTGVGAAVGLISIGVALLGNSDAEDNSLGEALASIHSAVMGMWTEMRESFHITWEMLQAIDAKLDKMDATNHRHFGILLATLDYYGGQSLAHLTYTNKSMHDHLSWMHYDLKSCLDHLIDEGAGQVIGEIDLKAEHELKASLPQYTTTLSSWLLNAVAKKSGALASSKAGKPTVPDSELITLLKDESALTKLGLLGSLANLHVANLVDRDAFIDTHDWVYVLRAFELLIKIGSGEIALSEKKSEYLKHLLSIKNRADAVMGFVVATMHGSSRLFSALLQEYKSALNAAGETLLEIVERKRITMNQNHHLLADQNLLRLDEHADKSFARIKNGPEGRPFPMIKAIDWDRVLIDCDPESPRIPRESFIMSHQHIRNLGDAPLLAQIRLLEADSGFNLAHAYDQAKVSGRYSMKDETHIVYFGGSPTLFWYCYRMNLVITCTAGKLVLPCAMGSLFVNETSPHDHRAKPLADYTRPSFECRYTSPSPIIRVLLGGPGHVATFAQPPTSTECPQKDLYGTLKLGALLEHNVLVPARKEAAKALQSAELSIQLDRLEAVRLQLLVFIAFLGGDPTNLEKLLLGRDSFLHLARQLETDGTVEKLRSILNALWVGASPKKQNSALLHLQAETAKALAGVRIMDHPLVLDMLVARNIIDYLHDLIDRKAQCDSLQQKIAKLDQYIDKLTVLALRASALEHVTMLEPGRMSGALWPKIEQAEEERRKLHKARTDLDSGIKATVGKDVPTPAGSYSAPPKAAKSKSASSAGSFFAPGPATAKRPIFEEAPINSAGHEIEGLAYEVIAGDGNCLFNAVALHLELAQADLRNLVAAHIEYNLDTYSYRAVIGALNPKMAEEYPEEYPKKYLEALRGGQEWADNLEIVALMKLLDRPIVVIGPDGKLMNGLDIEKFTGEPIFVHYNGHTHYDAYLLKKGWYERSREILGSLKALEERSLPAAAGAGRA